MVMGLRTTTQGDSVPAWKQRWKSSKNRLVGGLCGPPSFSKVDFPMTMRLLDRPMAISLDRQSGETQTPTRVAPETHPAGKGDPTIKVTHLPMINGGEEHSLMMWS